MNPFILRMEWEIKDARHRAECFLGLCVSEQSDHFYMEWRAMNARVEALAFALEQFRITSGGSHGVRVSST